MSAKGCVGYDVIELTLPWPPTINNYWRLARNHIYLSADGRAYRDEVMVAAAGKGRYGADTRLDVAITAYPPDRRRRDIDNLLKCTLDSLEAARVFVDDNQVDSLRIERAEVIKGGKLEIKIQSVSYD